MATPPELTHAQLLAQLTEQQRSLVANEAQPVPSPSPPLSDPVQLMQQLASNQNPQPQPQPQPQQLFLTPQPQPPSVEPPPSPVGRGRPPGSSGQFNLFVGCVKIGGPAMKTVGPQTSMEDIEGLKGDVFLPGNYTDQGISLEIVQQVFASARYTVSGLK